MTQNHLLSPHFDIWFPDLNVFFGPLTLNNGSTAVWRSRAFDSKRNRRLNQALKLWISQQPCPLVVVVNAQLGQMVGTVAANALR